MKNKMLKYIIADMFLFITGYLLFTYMLPLVIANPQDYLYSANTGIFAYGLFCLGIGVEIKSCISDYYRYKYLGERESEE